MNAFTWKSSKLFLKKCKTEQIMHSLHSQWPWNSFLYPLNHLKYIVVSGTKKKNSKHHLFVCGRVIYDSCKHANFCKCCDSFIYKGETWCFLWHVQSCGVPLTHLHISKDNLHTVWLLCYKAAGASLSTNIYKWIYTHLLTEVCILCQHLILV